MTVTDLAQTPKQVSGSNTVTIKKLLKLLNITPQPDGLFYLCCSGIALSIVLIHVLQAFGLNSTFNCRRVNPALPLLLLLLVRCNLEFIPAGIAAGTATTAAAFATVLASLLPRDSNKNLHHHLLISVFSCSMDLHTIWYGSQHGLSLCNRSIWH